MLHSLETPHCAIRYEFKLICRVFLHRLLFRSDCWNIQRNSRNYKGKIRPVVFIFSSSRGVSYRCFNGKDVIMKSRRFFWHPYWHIQHMAYMSYAMSYMAYMTLFAYMSYEIWHIYHMLYMSIYGCQKNRMDFRNVAIYLQPPRSSL